jgi:hypothetical protein
VLLGQVGADLAVDARDLEQGDVVGAGVCVAPDGFEQRGVENGTDRSRLRRERLRQP